MFRKLSALLRPSGSPSARERGVVDWVGDAREEAAPRIVLTGPFIATGGFGYRYVPPAAFTGPTDSAVEPRASRLILYEDGAPLGPRHSVQELIAKQGAGRYSHFNREVHFSASDNSDPNTNGRVYSFAVGEPSPPTAGLGGCHMNMLLRSLHAAGRLQLRGLDMGVAYSPLEQLRLVQHQLGLWRPPHDLAPLACATAPTAQDLLRAEVEIDLLLIETTSTTDAVVGDTPLNRAQILDTIITPAGALGREAHEQASRWYSLGVLKGDDEAREDAARILLALLPGTPLDTPAVRLALQEARGRRETAEEVREHLAAIRDLLKPQRMALIRGPNAFFPDGRSINWGGAILADLRSAAASLGAPLVDIGELVMEKGFAFSVMPDMMHHTDGFIDHLGEVVMTAVHESYGPWPWPEGAIKPLPVKFAPGLVTERSSDSRATERSAVADFPAGALPPGSIPLEGPFTHLEGHGFVVVPPARFLGPWNTAEQPRASWLALYEDGAPLGPRHESFETIATKGGGAYTHFLGQLFFSSSDGSDPNSNGRHYSAILADPAPVTIGFGGCHMNALVRAMHRWGHVDMRAVGMGVSYSPLEQLRIVEQQLGLRTEAEDVAPFAVSRLPEETDLLAPGLGAELLIIEGSSHTNAMLGDVCINRLAIMNEMLAPAEKTGREIYEEVSRWYSQGILRCDDPAREEAGRGVLAMLQGTPLDTPLIRRVLAEARGLRETPDQMVAHLSAIRRLLGVERMVLVRHPNTFLPDGRGLSWSPGLMKDLREVASRLKVPLVDAGALVLERGFASSVDPDLTHHTEAFYEALGGVVIRTVRDFYGPWRWPSGVPRPATPRFAP